MNLKNNADQLDDKNTAIRYSMDFVNNLPIEIRREVYTYIPQKHCSVCNQLLIRYPQASENKMMPWVCSVPCLVQYNCIIGRDIIIYSGAVRVINITMKGIHICINTGMAILSGTIFIGYMMMCVYLVWTLLRCLMCFATWLFYFF